jgi:peptidoglycan/LPS O-acetylase OafA/YrhL
VLVCICLVVLAPVITYLSLHTVFWQDYFYAIRPLIKFQPIAIGSLVASLMFTTKYSFEKYANLVTKLIVLGLAIAFYKLALPAELNRLLFAFFMSVFLVLNLYKKRDLVFFILNSRLMNQVGLMSYSLYIWQQLFTLNNMPWRNAFPYGDNIFVNLVLLFMVSYISYYYYERRFLKLKAKFT